MNEREIELMKVIDAVEGKPMFNLRVNGVEIYGMTVNTNSSGEQFIGFPRYKSRVNDKYYNHVYVDFTDAEKEAIIDSVLAEVAERKDASKHGKKVAGRR